MRIPILALLVVAGGMALVAPAAAADRVSTVVYRITDPPRFSEGPTAKCASFEARVPIRSPDGERIGRAVLCIQHDEFICDEAGCRLVEIGQLKVHLRGGKILADVVLVDRFSEDFSAAEHEATGVVTGARGARFGGRDASGTLAGSGTIMFDPDGTPRPDLTYRIELD